MEVLYSVAPEETQWTLEHLLDIFGFDKLRNERREMIYPMTTAVTRTVCPGIENMSRFWTDWGESLDGDHRINFVALELQVYESMHNSDTAGGFLWHFGETHNAAHTRQVVLEVHYMPSVDMVDMLSKLHFRAPTRPW